MGYPAFKYATPEEYLELEKDAIEKHEYFGGEIYAMAGATENHLLIVFNLNGVLYNYLNGKSCRGYSTDFRVATPFFNSYMYPDVIIVCGPTEKKKNCFNTLLNPAVIIEVMSRSTSERDRVIKFFFYRQIPSLKEYILIDSTGCYVQNHLKQEDGSWEDLVSEDMNGSFFIHTIGMELPLNVIYNLTSFEDEDE